jgi:cobalt-zinc-cadmium efflux system membrane fusion protein
LAGFAYVGSANDWKLKKLSAYWGAEEEDDEGKDKKAEETIFLGAPVTLPSERHAHTAGIEVEPARLKTMTHEVRATGVLAFDQTRHAQLATRVAGIAWRVPRKAGDRVQKGDVLAVVSSAEAAKARADLLSSLAQHQIKADVLRRLQSTNGSMPDRLLREAQATLREARIRLLNDHQALLNLGLSIRLDDLARLGDDEAANQLRRLGLPRDVVPEADNDLPATLLPLVAPFDGLVVRRDVVVGAVVTPTQPQFILADARRLWLLLDVRLEDAGLLAPRHAVTFRADATGAEVAGTVEWVSAEVDPKTRTVRARATIDNPEEKWRPGTFGTARITVSRTPYACAVPDAAVQRDGKVHRVFVRQDATTYAPRLVVPGRRWGGYTQLHDTRPLVAATAVGWGTSPVATVCAVRAADAAFEGVRPGEAVVTSGSHVLNSELLKHRIGGED